MGKSTKEEVMGDLHVIVTTKITDEIKKKDSDPKWTQMAIKMLADNKVFMTPEIENELGELDRHLQKKKKRRFGVDNITEFATKQAKAMNE